MALVLVMAGLGEILLSWNREESSSVLPDPDTGRRVRDKRIMNKEDLFTLLDYGLANNSCLSGILNQFFYNFLSKNIKN